jgi:hypothetical protein
MVTGNPVRNAISNATVTRADGVRFFSLDEKRK